MIRTAIIIGQLIVILSLTYTIKQDNLFDPSTLKCVEHKNRKLLSTTLDLVNKEFICNYMDEEVKQVKRR